MSLDDIYFIERRAYGDAPAGITVTKKQPLPEGDFRVTEYVWQGRAAYVELWFVDADEFTADERQIAYSKFLEMGCRCGS